jgi:hypothetical protein
MIVLAEVVRRMRARGKPEFEVADIFMDFNAIQVTFGVMAQALIDGRIDCKTSGRLAVGLQTAAKLLWMLHRKGREGRKESQISPQISADERRLGRRRASTTKDTRSTLLSQAQGRSGQAAEHEEEKQGIWAAKDLSANQDNGTRMGFGPEMLVFQDIRSRAHAPPGWARAA